MAIATFSDLKTAVVNWSARGSGDTDIAARLPEFIALFEAHAKDALRVPMGMVRDASFSVDAEYVAWPAAMVQIDSLALLTNPKVVLDRLPTGALDTRYAAASAGQPAGYALEGGMIRFAPAPDATYTARITYYGLPALSDAVPDNWLLTAYPDAYLWGTLAELAAYTQDTEGFAMAAARRDAILDRINAKARAAAAGAAPRASLDFVAA